MSNQRIIRLFGGEFAPLEHKAFEFTPSPHHKQIVAVFFSDDSELSLGLGNDTALPLHCIQQEYRTLLGIAPNQRMYRYTHPLNGVLRGRLQNLKTIHNDHKTRTINLYAIVEYESP